MSAEDKKAERVEAVRQITQALTHWGYTDVAADERDPTILYANLRSPYSSRVFTATIHVTQAKEV